jgi:hypothetical protein
MGAYGMLSRVYLSMNDYVDAGKYADSSLQINDALMDFNSFTINGNDPIAEGNVEMDFDYWMASGADGELTQNASVDTTLYGLYQANDLRKVCFFAPRGNYYSFLGSYVGIQFILWGGIATDEMYLTRAECEARNGNVDSAMADLNTLLTTRWTTGEFVPYTASGPADAINQILMERRKELLFRGTRWLDLRRLNKDPNYAVTLTRNVNGQIFTLPPNDPRYVFLIPPAETSYNNIPQNQR